ncbi:MAG: efflux RND transporter periplasmic adaptor subunit [Gammaproteobacteria bacterium]|nr:efflux RND transporter periplasmic adaptor subunit [Gammaproteobacteria bacterium]
MSRTTLVRKFIPLLVVALAILTAALLVWSRPEPERETPVDNGEPVQVQPVSRQLETLVIEAQGSVIPAREITVQPQVSGRVIAMGDNFRPGGRIAAGELLFAVDDSDYRLAVAQARTRVAEAEAALALEQGRQAVAQREWALFEDELASGDNDSALALREPQLQSARAGVAAARTQLQQAQLNLERTRISAPFNAVIRSENIDLGQIVGPQTAAARLAGTDTFWVQASVPAAQLDFVDIADLETSGSVATISYDTGTGQVRRQGEVIGLLSDLDRAGQMARVLIEISDPLATDRGRLLLDSFVDVEIRANRELDVIRLQPKWLHNGDEVYVYEDGVLRIRRVEVAWRRPDAVFVSSGLDENERIVVTTIATPIAGMKLTLDDTTGMAASTP